MANPLRGEVALNADGATHRLRLTLGALAELEQSLGCGGLMALAERLERDEIGAEDVIAILAAGFRGAGTEIDARTVGRMQVGGGAAEALRVAGALLRAAFTGAT